MTQFPVLVQFEYHPASETAAATAEYLHDTLNDDPSVPGLRVPTCFVAENGSMAPPAAQLADEAERVVVVLLADDHLAANARKTTKSGVTWADYVVQLREHCRSSPIHRFMPVQLTENGWPIDSRLTDVNFLRAWAFDDAGQRRKFIARRLTHLLIRQLQSHTNDSEASPVTIFLSHTKLDLESEPRVVRALLAHLIADQPEKTWFDSSDIQSGSQFARAIERGISDTALVAIVTDSYSSRSWCRREVLLAKQYQRPVVVVDAVRDREIRSFPYAGNAPVIRWNGCAEDVVDLLLRETLRHAYAAESLKQRKRPGDEVLPAGPELVTIVHRDKAHPVLYPDPPLGPEELAVLASSGIRVETPLERYARANDLRAKSMIVALSVSEAEDLAAFGLRKKHLDATLLEFSRYLLLAGIRLAYGGHLRPGGYTSRLADLLRDPIVEQLRGEAPADHTLPTELVVYLPWPTSVHVEDEARLGSLVEVRRCERPADVDESLDPALVLSPEMEISADTATRRFAWSRGLTIMRERQTNDVAARVIVGGRYTPAGEGYKGRMPGVLEEALLSIRAKRPVYLIGAFGGCARLTFDALEGRARQELTWEFQRAAPNSHEIRQMYVDRGQLWDDYEKIAGGLAKVGLGGLKNGLTVDENRELGTTRSVERMIELILTGLQKDALATGSSASQSSPTA
jgi:SLOG cluster2/TIR domain